MNPEKLLIFVKRNNLLTTKKTHFMKKFILPISILFISFLSKAQLIDPVIQEQAIQQMEIRDLQERLSLSSYYTVKSVNQRNLAMVTSIVGGILSTALITSDIKNGNTFMDKPFPYIIGAATTIGVLSFTISSNHNQKQAGLALKLK